VYEHEHIKVLISIAPIVKLKSLGLNAGITGRVTGVEPVTLYVIFGALASGWFPEIVISVHD
jgi:hypothetical protein